MPVIVTDLEKNRRWSSLSYAEKAESVLTTTAVDELSSPIEDSKAANSDELEVDGGLAAWVTVFGAFLALVSTFGQLNSFGTFQSWYLDNQLSHLSPSTISWIGSAQLWVFFTSVSHELFNVMR